MNTPIYDAHSFWELLNRRVADSPDRPMLIDDTDRTFTFAEVYDRAERVAAGFAGHKHNAAGAHFVSSS